MLKTLLATIWERRAILPGLVVWTTVILFVLTVCRNE